MKTLQAPVKRENAPSTLFNQPVLVQAKKKRQLTAHSIQRADSQTHRTSSSLASSGASISNQQISVSGLAQIYPSSGITNLSKTMKSSKSISNLSVEGQSRPSTTTLQLTNSILKVSDLQKSAGRNSGASSKLSLDAPRTQFSSTINSATSSLTQQSFNEALARQQMQLQSLHRKSYGALPTKKTKISTYEKKSKLNVKQGCSTNVQVLSQASNPKSQFTSNNTQGLTSSLRPTNKMEVQKSKHDFILIESVPQSRRESQISPMNHPH
ncbi:hypothetical protein FGO68_gene6571 [Halteria grandinella]|uniref:Uncharacterized protein n=1 Tax=Halteria grandinella TaxID=5974 RepID=A0A8J8T8K4_HALGN|nr:hypothetical protein FGO68_gene6571 [Halteria grandinella]